MHFGGEDSNDTHGSWNNPETPKIFSLKGELGCSVRHKKYSSKIIKANRPFRYMEFFVLHLIQRYRPSTAGKKARIQSECCPPLDEPTCSAGFLFGIIGGKLLLVSLAVVRELLSVEWIWNSEDGDLVALLAKSANRCTRNTSNLVTVRPKHLQSVDVLCVNESKLLLVLIDRDLVCFAITLEERVRIFADRKGHFAADDAHRWIGCVQASLTDEFAVQFNAVGGVHFLAERLMCAHRRG